MNPVFGQDKAHVVKSGETLSGIARKYKTTIAELNRLNPNAVKGLKVGEALIIAGEAPEKQAPAKTTEADGDAKKHTVKSGESLSRIAKKYHVQVKDLEEWNGITSKDLKAGQELIVSGTSGSGSVKTEPKAAIQEKEQPEETTSLGQAVHTVVKGETLSAIAKKEGTTVAELKKLNGLKSTQVNLGQELK
jgi:LysM repeat protein